MDQESFFWKVQAGKLPPPNAAALLGMVVREVSLEEGTVEADFEAKPDFTNSMGNVQGGFLAAMLDDTLGISLAATLKRDETAPTVNLNVSFMRPAKPGALTGRGRILKRGSGVCFMAGELYQNGAMVASATATAAIRRR